MSRKQKKILESIRKDLKMHEKANYQKCMIKEKSKGQRLRLK